MDDERVEYTIDFCVSICNYYLLILTIHFENVRNIVWIGLVVTIRIEEK